MKNKSVWQFILDCLQRQSPVLLIAVVESHGASPGKAGFKMAVAANGERRGTIGGGIMEMTWIERSAEILSHPDAPTSVRHLFHSRESKHEQSGLICSGSQSVLFRVMTPKHLPDVENIVRVYNEFGVGTLQISATDFSFWPNRRNDVDCEFTLTSETDWKYKENLGVLDSVYVVGSGHVGLALTRIMSTLDFRVVVFDDRPEAETFAENTFAHGKVCTSYDKVGDHMLGTGREYVAVVTTAYKTDEAALLSIFQKNPKYIGLMGSDAKADQIFADLSRAGVSNEILQRIHVPIGIPIASHTPEEIAISIAAEIIKERNDSVA
ncbi:MAG: XdhC family protein [Ignavibacteriae bacterium]|nr:XdhC family protein [Ignavibacteriota bacterium]